MSSDRFATLPSHYHLVPIETRDDGSIFELETISIISTIPSCPSTPDSAIRCNCGMSTEKQSQVSIMQSRTVIQQRPCFKSLSTLSSRRGLPARGSYSNHPARANIIAPPPTAIFLDAAPEV